MANDWLREQAAITLERLLPRLTSALKDDPDADRFFSRLQPHFPVLFENLLVLYGSHYDFFYHLEQMLMAAAAAFRERTQGLRQLDEQRQANPGWFQLQTMMGGVCYVDRFGGDLQGIAEKIPYFEELGLTYLHLMPLYHTPELNNDGGYAVSSFREVNPAFGTMEDLARLAEHLREHGISLVLDFVFNHTADEHEWAKQAIAGDRQYQAYYLMFDDRTLPDQYQPYLREIFPEHAPGSFTWRQDVQKWVWTTFYPFQWDLNYANPALFTAMLGEMLFLANQGVEVLRLDAVPFVWKQLGTNCENLPQVHNIIHAYNALMRIACPALLFKSEAIVHPRDVRSYIAPDSCQISYNPIMMVSLWEALATRDVRFFTHTLRKQFPLDPRCAWVNYIRSHDDIGWGFADEDAADLNINGFDHRNFLNQFYTGQFPGSFGRGLPFNYNPKNGDMRITGTTASLIGLEDALIREDAIYVENAIKRIHLVYGFCLAAGGIPLLYLGDELAMLNDYTFSADPAKRHDSRWVHRPMFDAVRAERRHTPNTVEARVFEGLSKLIRLRKSLDVLANAGDTEFLDSGNAHVAAFARHGGQLVVLGNFSDDPQSVDIHLLGMQGAWHDLFSDARMTGNLADGAHLIALEPYQLVWLVPHYHENRHTMITTTHADQERSIT